jgi:hypothetical protein
MKAMNNFHRRRRRGANRGHRKFNKIIKTFSILRKRWLSRYRRLLVLQTEKTGIESPCVIL